MSTSCLNNNSFLEKGDKMIVRVVPTMSTGIFFLFLNSYINNKENYIQGNMWLDLCVAAL